MLKIVCKNTRSRLPELIALLLKKTSQFLIQWVVPYRGDAIFGFFASWEKAEISYLESTYIIFFLQVL